MDKEYQIELRLDSENKGGFYIEDNNRVIARMEISVQGGRLIVYHTEVDEDLKGLNLGKKLLGEMVTYARKNNLKVFPYCPYVHAQFRRYPELYGDVWLKTAADR
jgi:predicted GNAT family acetyltransferase